MATTKFNYGEDTLTYSLAFEIADGKIAARLSESQKKIISLSRKNVENALEADKKIYGITTPEEREELKEEGIELASIPWIEKDN